MRPHAVSKLVRNRSAGVRKPHTDEVPKHSKITITKIISKTAFVLTYVSQSKPLVRREAWEVGILLREQNALGLANI